MLEKYFVRKKYSVLFSYAARLWRQKEPKEKEKKNHAIPNEEFGMPNLFHQSDKFFDQRTEQQQTFFLRQKTFAVELEFQSSLFLSLTFSLA